MYKGGPVKSFVFSSRSGCLLPTLIIFNLLFGWLFFKVRYWLLIEGILLLFFAINGYITMRRIISASTFSSKHHNAVDVEGKVVEDEYHRSQKSVDNF